MLQALRDKTHGWITRTIFGLVCVAFILWGTHSFLTSSGSRSDAPARVNGTDITGVEINQAYQNLVQEQKTQLGSNFILTDQMQAKLKKMAVEQVVTATALMQSAKKNGIRFTPEQVGTLIAGFPAFQQDGHFSQQKFSEILANMGLSENTFFNNIRDDMMVNQLRFGIIASSIALPNEINQTIQLLNQKRDITYAILTTKSVSEKVSITEDEIKQYYQQHQDKFTLPQTVTVQYIELALPDFIKKVVVSDNELQKAYQENVDPTKQTFEQAKESLRKNLIGQKATQAFSDAVDQLTNLSYTTPQNLEPAAKALNVSIQTSKPLLANQPAESGLFAHDAVMTAVFSEPVLKGNNSPVINLDDHDVVVVRVLNQTPAHVKPFDTVRSEIVNLVREQKAQSLIESQAQNLVSQILSGKSLIDAAKEKGLTVFQEKNIGRFNDSQNANIYAHAFQMSPPGRQPSAALFKLPLGKFAVIQVLKVTESTSNSDEDKAQQRVIAEKIANAQAQVEYALYAHEVLANSKISINNKLKS